MKRLIVIIIALFSLTATTNYVTAQVAVGVSVGVAPPALPVYVQPPCPVDGYLWSPGYWAWDPDSQSYYWVPGVWVEPPAVGFLWTPGYWGFLNGAYFWHGGYWGPHIGFYGGVCYGFGYWGHGFYGGRWAGGRFHYNTAVWHVNNKVVHNTYVDRTVVRNAGSRSSFNGRGGVRSQPTKAEKTAMSEHHSGVTSAQRSNQSTASSNKSQRASVNHGRPATTAMDKVGGKQFNSSGRTASANKTAVAKNTKQISTRSRIATSHTNNNKAMASKQVKSTRSNNTAHASATKQQPQHNYAQRRTNPQQHQLRPAQQEHAFQNRPPVQTQRNMPSRMQQAQPGRGMPGGSRGGFGGRGGGGNGKRH